MNLDYPRRRIPLTNPGRIPRCSTAPSHEKKPQMPSLLPRVEDKTEGQIGLIASCSHHGSLLFEYPISTARIEVYELKSAPQVYRIEGRISKIDKSRFCHLLVATAIFGLSLGILASSVVSPQVALIAPWFFWLIPVIGSFGVAWGIVINFVEEKAFDSELNVSLGME